MPRPGGACSAYLIEAGGTAVLVDAGPGSMAKLQLAIDYTRLDAIVISHVHADHFFDLVPLRQGLRHGPSSRADRQPLFLPPGGSASLGALQKAVSPDAPGDFFDAVYAVDEYDPQRPLRIGHVELRFARTRHYIEGYAIRAGAGDASVTYSSDTAPCDAVVELARRTSLFLCEAALGLDEESGERGHSSAEEAGEMARRAEAQRLVLTHYGVASAPHLLVDAAKRRYGGHTEAAEDGLVFGLGGVAGERERDERVHRGETAADHGVGSHA